jgi:hypothetical protein
MAFLFTFLNQITNAQDKNAEAIASYTKAEEFYNFEKYDSCARELSYAEKILGGTNSKILYLKTKATLKLCQQNDFKLYEEDSLIKEFFAITNVQSYPSDKYSEIINVKREFETISSTRNPIFLKRNLAELPLSETLNDLKYLMPQGNFSNLNDKNPIVEVTIEKPLFKTGIFWYAIAFPIIKKPSYAYGLIFINNFIESPLIEQDGRGILGVKTYCDVKGGHVDFYHPLKTYSKHRLAGMKGMNYGTGKEGVVFNTKEIPSENNIFYLVFYSLHEQPIKINYFFTIENTSLDLDKYFSIGGDNLEKLGFDKNNTSYGNSPNYKFLF